MPDPNSPEQDDSRDVRDSYLQLGLTPEATMHEIEAAYWRFARELRGQAAMAPYTRAYEALVNRTKPRPIDARGAPAAPPEAAQKPYTLAARPPSKLGWPA
jgi:curved DNA-binding protein CbpA